MTATSSGPGPIGTLLAHAIDYAGLFPPAQLDMAGAVAEYSSYLASDARWALGRFVIPAARLDELADVAAEQRGAEALGDGSDEPQVSAVLGADLAIDVSALEEYNDSYASGDARWWTGVVAVELRAATPSAIDSALGAVPATFQRFVEVPIAADPTELVRAFGPGGGFAKVRTGGVTADGFPSASDLTRFLSACVRLNVPFKATAGLHHPLRGEYRLTYAPDSASAPMYGFLNVFLAAAILRAGASERVAAEVLQEADATSIRFDRDGVVWRDHRLSSAQLADTRGVAIQSFGSCSFREPIDDLAAIGLL